MFLKNWISWWNVLDFSVKCFLKSHESDQHSAAMSSFSRLWKVEAGASWWDINNLLKKSAEQWGKVKQIWEPVQCDCQSSDQRSAESAAMSSFYKLWKDTCVQQTVSLPSHINAMQYFIWLSSILDLFCIVPHLA